MCGIAGILGVAEELTIKATNRMLAAMQHRGPDGSGIKKLSGRSGGHSIVLLHSRLAILDLSASGNQPMADVPSNYDRPANWIVFNGEIYNFLSLYRELENAGWPCRTRCDTEVILNAFRVWGEEYVSRLEGMFAWCLVDTTQEKVWLCRDRIGIKPLYIYRPPDGGLLFASEIRTLLAVGEELVPPIIRRTALESFLAQGAVCGSQSIIAGIESLEPGQSLMTDWIGRTISSRTYWRIPFVSDSEIGQLNLNRNTVVENLADALRESVKLHLLSDVPIGIFLSGGIDSSVIATIAKEVSSTQIQTITLGFDEKEFDETQAAELVAQHLGTSHKNIRLSGQTVLNNLPEFLSAMDQPTVDGFNTFFVSRATREAGLTVALSGLGGDELFGGYASFRDVNRAISLRENLRNLNSLNTLFANTSKILPGRAGLKLAELWERPPLALDMYLLRRELFMPSERRRLHPLPEGSDPVNGVPLLVVNKLRQQGGDADTIKQVSFFELSFYMRYMLLQDADIFSMASSLELRVPLLDRKIVELVFRLPSAWKAGKSQPKSLLIDAAGPRLPLFIQNLPKRGFTFPWYAWLSQPLFNRVEKSIRNYDVWEQLGFNPLAVEMVWQQFLQKSRRVSPVQIIAFLVLEDYVQRHSLRLSI